MDGIFSFRARARARERKKKKEKQRKYRYDIPFLTLWPMMVDETSLFFIYYQSLIHPYGPRVGPSTFFLFSF